MTKPCLKVTQKAQDTRPYQKGLTFLELIVSMAILSILASVVFPLSQIATKQMKELELKRALRQIRTALDAYKQLADQQKIQTETDTFGYPETLQSLVDGVEMIGTKQRVKFLRRIPIDPMTHSMEWGLSCHEDPTNSRVWCGKNVYDLFTTSTETALDGTKYQNW